MIQKVLFFKKALPETATEHQKGDWYLQQAMEFERSKREAEQRSTKIAWRINIGLMILTGITVISSACLLFINKPTPPVVLQVNSTGDVNVLKTLTDGKITYGEATDITYLKKYVEFRESYDWETIQDTFDATVLMSDEKEAEVYKETQATNNPNSPVNILKDQYRVLVKAGTVSFIGKTALVYFEKKLIPIPLSGQKPMITHYVATISFEYRNFKMTDAQRAINAPGFKALSYRAIQDVSKDTMTQGGANP